MKNITNIKKISSNKYKLIIDNEPFIVYEDVIIKYNILTNKTITDEEFKDILATKEYYEAYFKIIKYITFKLRTEDEIKVKLHSSHINDNNISLIVNRLRDEGYLDEDLYVKSFINDALNLSFNGPNKILYELKCLHISNNTIDKYLTTISEEIWQEKINKIISKKIKSNHNLSEKMLKQKIRKDLISLGYDNDIYLSQIDDINIDDNEIMKKEYNKLYSKYSKKYSDSKLDSVIKQKLYMLGFDYSDMKKDS